MCLRKAAMYERMSARVRPTSFRTSLAVGRLAQGVAQRRYSAGQDRDDRGHDHQLEEREAGRVVRPFRGTRKRRGNRRYYQRGDVIMIRQIRSLLYEQGFTISGARQQL